METFVKITHTMLARTDLTPSAKLVYANIADRIGDNGECWPSIDRIMADVGLTRHTVIRALRELEAGGLVKADRPGAGICNRYRLTSAESALPTSAESALPTSAEYALPPVQKAHSGSAESALRPVQKAHCNQTKRTRPREPDQENKALPEKRNLDNSRKRAMKFDPLSALSGIQGSPLDSPAFRSAWAEWATHRREIHRPLTQTAVKRQLADLTAWGHDAAVTSIQTSIAAGWQGLFPPKSSKQSAGDAAFDRAWENAL